MRINRISTPNFKGQIVSKPNREELKESLNRTGYYTEKQIHTITGGMDKFYRYMEQNTPDDTCLTVSVTPEEIKLGKESARSFVISVRAEYPKKETAWVYRDGGIITSKENEEGKNEYKDSDDIDRELQKKSYKIAKECSNFDPDALIKRFQSCRSAMLKYTD